MWCVAANHENDTCFGNGLVMGSADCMDYARLVKTLEKLFKRKLGLCQTHCRQVPVFSRLSKCHMSNSSIWFRRYAEVRELWGLQMMWKLRMMWYPNELTCELSRIFVKDGGYCKSQVFNGVEYNIHNTPPFETHSWKTVRINIAKDDEWWRMIVK